MTVHREVLADVARVIARLAQVHPNTAKKIARVLWKSDLLVAPSEPPNRAEGV